MNPYPINAAGVELLKQSEQFVGAAYPDPVSPLGRALQRAGLWRQTLRGVPIPDSVRTVKGKALTGTPWTIGWGFTDGVNENATMSLAEANSKLARLLVGYRDKVLAACTVAPNENQLAAMVVCAWNIGIAALIGSTIMKAHNRSDFAAAARAFSLWNKAGGSVSQALVTRRAAEAALYARPAAGAPAENDAQIDAMPQTVQAEGSLWKSPIVTSTIGGASTTVATLASVADQVSTAKSAVDQLSPFITWLPYIGIAVVIIVAGVIIWQRIRQRRGGWA